MIKNTIKKMYCVLTMAFREKSVIWIGYYALLTAETLIFKYLDKECESAEEFKEIQTGMIAVLSEFTKGIYSRRYKRGNK